MTVKELRSLLTSMPEDAILFVEGAGSLAPDKTVSTIALSYKDGKISTITFKK